MRAGLPGIGIVSTMRGRCPSGAAGWWDPLSEGLCVWGAWQGKGVVSYAASLVDLSGNGNNLGDPGGAATPAWAALTGWTFDGIGDYLTTTFVPQNDQSQAVLVQYTGVTNTGSAFGQLTAANSRLYVDPDTGTGRVYYVNGGATVAVIPQLLAGNLGISGNSGYRNGVLDTAALPAYGSASTRTVYLGCRNQGVALNFMAGDVQAFVIYDCTLTGPQMLTVATAMALL